MVPINSLKNLMLPEHMFNSFRRPLDVYLQKTCFGGFSFDNILRMMSDNCRSAPVTNAHLESIVSVLNLVTLSIVSIKYLHRALHTARLEPAEVFSIDW
jgi:hypothetical protein